MLETFQQIYTLKVNEMNLTLEAPQVLDAIDRQGSTIKSGRLRKSLTELC